MKKNIIIYLIIFLTLLISSCNDEEKCKIFSENLLRRPQILDSLVACKSELIHSQFFLEIVKDSIDSVNYFNKYKSLELSGHNKRRTDKIIFLLNKYIDNENWYISSIKKFNFNIMNSEAINVKINSKSKKQDPITIIYVMEDGIYKFCHIIFKDTDSPAGRYFY